MLRVVVVGLALFGASGCTLGNFTSIYRTPDLTSGRSVLVDAEQYGILSIPYPGDEKYRTVCAMPSPDALAAAAASGTLSIDAPSSTDGSGAFGAGESAASIGLRTQSIQLLRDAFYRLCEGYASGGIDDLEFGIMQRRFQNNMIAILAVEQLTGAVRAQSAAVSASGSASAATLISSLVEERRSMSDEVATLTATQPTAEANKTEHDRIQRIIDSRTKGIAAIDGMLSAAGQGDASAIAQLRTDAITYQSTISGETAVALSQAVEAITLAALNQDLNMDFCLEVMRLEPDKRDTSGSESLNPRAFSVESIGRMRDYCTSLTNDGLYRRSEFVLRSSTTIEALIANPDLTEVQLRGIVELLAQLDPDWSRGDYRLGEPRPSVPEEEVAEPGPGGAGDAPAVANP